MIKAKKKKKKKKSQHISNKAERNYTFRDMAPLPLILE